MTYFRENSCFSMKFRLCVSLGMKKFVSEKKGLVYKGNIECEKMGKISNLLVRFHYFPPTKPPWRIP